ncbi:MAG: hypothetical protein IKM66_09460 [Clostridia bacterium]|nr:hypothetical protein [Clostridia bacterium]
MKKKNVLKIISFLLAFVLTFAGIVHVLDFKYLDSIFKVDSFYELEDNTVDVLVIGSSHAYQGINTAVLWKDFGIAAFNFCGAAQPIWNTYYYLEEALKTQTPKAIILDTYYVHMSDDYTDESTAIKNTYGLKYSSTKGEAIKASFNTEKSGNQYFFSILQYHSRYSDLNKADFYPYQANEAMYKNHKGFYCYFHSDAVPERDLTEIEYYNTFTEKIDYYYRKIFELANSKNIPLIPIAIPFNAENYHQGFFNTAKYVAEEEYGVKFYNFITDYKSAIGLDYTTDFADKQHLNHLGNTKLTTFLGNLLKNEYKVPDRRGDEKYESWEADAEVYYKQLENHQVTKISNLTDYAKVFKNNRYKIIMTSSFPDYEELPEASKLYLEILGKALGITTEEQKTGGMWIFENGKKTYYNDCSQKNFTKAVKLGQYGGIEIRHTEKMFDETETFFVNSIHDNKKEVTVASYGLNIYVYDNFTQSKVDMVALKYSDSTFYR